MKGFRENKQSPKANMQAEQKVNMLTVVSDAIKHIDKCHNSIKKFLLILKRSAREFTETPDDLATAKDFC